MLRVSTRPPPRAAAAACHPQALCQKRPINHKQLTGSKNSNQMLKINTRLLEVTCAGDGAANCDSRSARCCDSSWAAASAPCHPQAICQIRPINHRQLAENTGKTQEKHRENTETQRELVNKMLRISTREPPRAAIIPLPVPPPLPIRREYPCISTALKSSWSKYPCWPSSSAPHCRPKMSQTTGETVSQ